MEDKYIKISDLNNYVLKNNLGTQVTYSLNGTTLTITTK